MKISPKLIVGGVVFALAVSCFNSQDRASDGASSTGSTAAAAPLARPTGNLPANYHAIYGVYFDTPDGRHEQGCHDNGGVYDGGLACHVGGETVVVTRAVDGDTVELSDGRRVRILGVDAPEVGTCGADAATAYTQAALVGNRLVVLHREPGVTKDQHGRDLGHLQYVTSDTNKHWAQPASGDLGNALALEGLVDVYEGGDGNATYTEAIRRSVDIAKQVHGGNWGPPCGEPAPTYEPEPADDSDTDVYVDTDVDDDGGGESRFCRGKWWC